MGADGISDRAIGPDCAIAADCTAASDWALGPDSEITGFVAINLLHPANAAVSNVSTSQAV
jgi:hypothetical protein